MVGVRGACSFRGPTSRGGRTSTTVAEALSPRYVQYNRSQHTPLTTPSRLWTAPRHRQRRLPPTGSVNPAPSPWRFHRKCATAFAQRKLGNGVCGSLRTPIGELDNPRRKKESSCRQCMLDNEVLKWFITLRLRSCRCPGATSQR